MEKKKKKEKINMKIVINMNQCISALSCRKRYYGPNLLKSLQGKNTGNTNAKNVVSSWKWTPIKNFGQFWEQQGLWLSSKGWMENIEKQCQNHVWCISMPPLSNSSRLGKQKILKRNLTKKFESKKLKKINTKFVISIL